MFQGLGQYSQEYDIELKQDAIPVVQPNRTVPYARREKLKVALDKLEQAGVIASVEKPTDWVNNLVITDKKDGSIRICLDPKPLNAAIKRQRYVIPTPNDVRSRLAGKKIFTVIDMKDAYWHVVLGEKSSYYCTFNTPWGRKRFLRMPFGICSASEVLQQRNDQTFGDIDNVYVIADDLIVAGVDDNEHDEAFLKVLDREREKNVRFRPGKIQYKVSEVMYMGDIISAAGLRPDLAKVEAIVKMAAPEDKQALQRLLGMVKYLTQYIPNESDLTAPLRGLLKEGAAFVWQPEHQAALDAVKSALVSAPVLLYYDVSQPCTVQADAYQTGLGACLMQGGQPIAYVSRTLMSAEANYAQIEKELLAICFACAKFHCYIYGKELQCCQITNLWR